MNTPQYQAFKDFIEECDRKWLAHMAMFPKDFSFVAKSPNPEVDWRPAVVEMKAKTGVV